MKRKWKEIYKSAFWHGMYMESILIFTIKKGIFKADSVDMGLFYKDTVKASATLLNKLSQNTSDYNIDIILGDFNIYNFLG